MTSEVTTFFSLITNVQLIIVIFFLVLQSWIDMWVTNLIRVNIILFQFFCIIINARFKFCSTCSLHRLVLLRVCIGDH